MQRKHLFVALTASLGLAGAIAFAANRGVLRMPSPPIEALAGATSAHAIAPDGVSANFAATNARMARKPSPAGPTVDDVGDLDSFGRNVRWLGQRNEVFGVGTDCAAWIAEDPAARCQQVANPGAPTPYQFADLLHFNLPANASNSMFCYLLTPIVAAWSRWKGLVDRPNSRRKTHVEPTPRTGGIAIAVAYVIPVCVLMITPLNAADAVNVPLVMRLLPAAAIVFMTGLLDDVTGLRPWEKL